LRYIPDGQVHTLDFLDVSPWLRPERYQGRLVCHQVTNGSFDCVADETFDFFFSFGVLCHNTTSAIRDLMANSLPKMKPRATAIHEYGDWQKLNQLGWQDNCGVPAFFRELPDDDERNWWPRNDPEKMTGVCREAGWIVDQADLGLFERDSVIQLRAPAP
jgi:hypothetical protein